MNGSRLVRVLSLSLLLVLVLGLIGTAVAQDDNILVIGWEQEPTLLTPRQDMTFGQLLVNFYARDVWDWDVNRAIYPVMVEEVPTLDNGMARTLDNGNTQVEYKLREGLVWSDGESITSADCAFMHELMMDPTTLTFQRSVYPEVVESFEVVDDTTFILTYNRPYPDFQSSAYATCYLPEHVFRPMLEETGNIDEHPYFRGEGVVGYGPYVLSEWNLGNSITFETNANWDGQEPAFGRVILRFIAESAQQLNALETGEIDVAFQWSDDLVDAYGALDNVEVFSTPGVYGDAVWMNVGNGGHPALSDPIAREGIIRAIDRATLAEELIGPGIGVPKSWFADQFWAEDLPLWEYDVDLANQLLDEAGWVDSNGDGIRDKDGVEMVLRFFTTTSQLRMDYQVFIQEYLSEVGIATQLLPVPANILFGSFLERGILSTGDFDLAIFALSTGPLSPAADAPSWFGCGGIPTAENPNGNNGWGSCSPEFDALDLQVLSTVDPVERLALAHEAQREFFDLGVWHGLYLRPTWYAFRSDVLDTGTVRDLGTLSANYFNKIEFWAPAG
jgi:peptide/nickel transport system substrate-binding protein